jgi:hypothetical protein
MQEFGSLFRQFRTGIQQRKHCYGGETEYGQCVLRCGQQTACRFYQGGWLAGHGLDEPGARANETMDHRIPLCRGKSVPNAAHEALRDC